jgi:hypothetical protein
MARSRTITPGSDPGEGYEFPQIDHPGLNAWNKSGDYAALSDPSFSEWDWTVYRLHTPEEVARHRPATPRLWVGRMHGPLDLSQIQSDYGGGTFELWGKFDGQLLAKPRVDVSGPRKDFNALPAPVPASREVGKQEAPAIDPTLAEILANQQRSMDLLLARALDQHAAPSAPAAPPFTIQDMLAVLAAVKKEAPAPSAMAEALTAFKEGIALRDQLGGSDGGGERSNLDVILERVMPVVERVGGQILSAAAVANERRRAAGSPAGSSATVVTPAVPTGLPATPPAAPDLGRASVIDAPVPAPADSAPAGDHRMSVAVELLADGLANGDGSDDTADTIARVLSGDELTVLCSMTDADVVAILRQRAGGAFPVLLEPRAEPFIAGVLADLRREDEPAPAP